MRWLLLPALACLASLGCDNTNKPAAVEPDNTAVNERDRDGRDGPALTPIDQNENQTDVNITADIRKQIVATDNLSVNAQNVKVITQDRKVTLRGPVASVAERDAIDAIAKRVAGAENVVNQLEIAN